MDVIRRAIALCSALLLTSTATIAATAPKDSSSTRQYARVLRTFNPHLTPGQSRAFADHVRSEAQYYRLDARLLVALIAIESSWHPYVTSPVGAGGLGQLMPGTAAGLGVNAYSPFANLQGTAHYLRSLLDRFSVYNQRTRYAFALAGYNAGPGAVERFGGVPPYTETQNYVRNVLGVWHQLTRSLSSHIDDSAPPLLALAPPSVPLAHAPAVAAPHRPRALLALTLPKTHAHHAVWSRGVHRRKTARYQR